jgi:hypothetical protein
MIEMNIKEHSEPLGSFITLTKLPNGCSSMRSSSRKVPRSLSSGTATFSWRICQRDGEKRGLAKLKARIIQFDPDPSLFRWLEATTWIWQKNVCSGGLTRYLVRFPLFLLDHWYLSWVTIDFISFYFEDFEKNKQFSRSINFRNPPFFLHSYTLPWCGFPMSGSIASTASRNLSVLIPNHSGSSMRGI